MSEYQRILEWLYTLEAAKGMDFKLERVALALRSLGDPHRRFSCIHIAGTNGKGSVAAMLHAILGAAGYRVGLYISPHLVRFTERIRVGEEEISETDVVTLAGEIQRAVTSRGIDLTFFEFVTVMGFLHFARCGVEIGVIEVGLGGRLDATNVVDPLVSVITTIGRDHTEFLGRSLASVATEKGGIIKPGRPVVLGRVGSRAASVLRRIATERSATVVQAGREFDVRAEPTPAFVGRGWELAGVTLALRGAYQRDNAATALSALALVRDRFPVTDAAARRGLASVRWPGRLEMVGRSPLTILDGAHNPDGMAALVEGIGPFLDGRPVHALFAVMRDKDWRAMVDRLGPVCQSVTVTEVRSPRGLPAALAARRFAMHCATSVNPDPLAAFDEVRCRAGESGVALVVGSLFLVGAVYPSCDGLDRWSGAMRMGAVQP